VSQTKRSCLALLGIALLLGYLAVRGKSWGISQSMGNAMGCRWKLTCRGVNLNDSDIPNEVSDLLEHWEQVMSTWRKDSDLSRYNRGEPASADLQRVLALAEKMRVATDGAFDERMLEQVNRIGFAPKGKGVDLSAIGKGFAADRVAEHLRARGINDFLFQIAGETIAGDKAWDVGIEAPDPTTRTVTKTIRLQNRALATSGNYRQFEKTERGIVSHIIDPRTGESVIRPFSAVTVIANDCATADAWATALFVRGVQIAPPSIEFHWQEPPPHVDSR
jgi:thiamine biosynthesis lipoprotein